jgi:hypothetical protein
MESKSFPSNFDIAGRYAKHWVSDFARYEEQGESNLSIVLIILFVINKKTPNPSLQTRGS